MNRPFLSSQGPILTPLLLQELLFEDYLTRRCHLYQRACAKLRVLMLEEDVQVSVASTSLIHVVLQMLTELRAPYYERATFLSRQGRRLEDALKQINSSSHPYDQLYCTLFPQPTQVLAAGVGAECSRYALICAVYVKSLPEAHFDKASAQAVHVFVNVHYVKNLQEMCREAGAGLFFD